MCLHYYYCYWCSFCASAERKPCTLGISHSSQSFCSYTKHLSEDFRRSQLTDLLNLCHSSCFWYFLYVFHHPILNMYQAHQQPQGSLRFSYATFFVFLVLDLCTCFSFSFPSERCFNLMEQLYQSVCRGNSLNLVCSLLQFCQYSLTYPIMGWCCCLYCASQSLAHGDTICL